MSKVIPSKPHLKLVTNNFEEVLELIQAKLDEEASYWIDYYSTNEDNVYAEAAIEDSTKDFDEIVYRMRDAVHKYDEHLFEYLTSILSSDQQEDFVDWVHDNADLVMESGFLCSPTGVVLGHCSINELCTEVPEEIVKLAEDNGADLEVVEGFIIQGDYLYTCMGYDTWYFRLSYDLIDEAIEYLKELNERRD